MVYTYITPYYILRKFKVLYSHTMAAFLLNPGKKYITMRSNMGVNAFSANLSCSKS